MEHLARNGDVKSLFIRKVEGVDNFGDVSVKPMMAGREMTLLEIQYPPGAGAPQHIHQHETLCYVVSGSVHVWVGGEEFDMLPGDVCRHPQGVPHAIRGIEHATVLEVKSPAQPLAAFLAISED
jgi:quercetin dioxygenase-like cupin family protein